MNVYITFGQVHVHSVNGKTFDKDCVAVIDSASLATGHNLAIDIFNSKFHSATATVPDMDYFPRGLIEVIG